ncbi:MAG: phosphate/phosphite/phosphonate ABC transporter substrate-binding protein [Sulfuricurvum sp.]|jgi:phosphonate transport system substrate-binding protein|uniref:phosphate/phosphite/phosphonate ABC transporter substrate-binding protein n=1 Tax=Sulfuricurvum sp. TaxID=2025608 RepID=UPI0025E7810B|nr:PhnD/SsuA/transferrin family substrate-binding protein [Sulfuricurvum sp.]MCK9372762.1 phosphate/phosphite/phosphonate ABC transporter substrate-binding protein [Sulfuricurvum sp.]
MKKIGSSVLGGLLLLIVLFFTGCLSEGDKAVRYTPSTSVTPANSEWIVGIHPYLNSQKTFLAYEPILRYWEHQTGLRLRLETSLDYADYERKLYGGHFDLSLPNPYQTLKSLEYGYRIVAKVKPDSEFRGVIVARKDRYIRSVEQLRGEVISFPAPTALAATLMPKWFLFEHGLNVDKESFPRYVGSQYSSIMNAYTKDAVAAATWPAPWKRWQLENPQKAKEMELVWETAPLVNNGVVVRSDLNATLVEKLTVVLGTMDRDPTAKKLLLPTGFAGFEKADTARYEPVRKFLIRYDRAIGLPK